MKRALVRTFFLLLPKLSCTNPFDKTCIDNTELKIEIKILQLIEKQDGKTRGGVVGGCAVGVVGGC